MTKAWRGGAGRLLAWLLLGMGTVAPVGCMLGTPGELGQGRFEYYCAGESDPYCDPAFTFDGTPCTSACVDVSGYDSQQVPAAIAVGATFSLSYRSDLSYSSYGRELFTASEEMLLIDGWDADGRLKLTALEPGQVAVIVREGTFVEDYLHLSLRVPSRVSFQRIDPEATPRTISTGLSLDPGEVTWIRAVPLYERSELYGALPCAWTADGTAIHFISDRGDNLVGVQGDATGMAEVRIDIGDLEAGLPVTVGDATMLWGGAL